MTRVMRGNENCNKCDRQDIFADKRKKDEQTKKDEEQAKKDKKRNKGIEVYKERKNAKDKA